MCRSCRRKSAVRLQTLGLVGHGLTRRHNDTSVTQRLMTGVLSSLDAHEVTEDGDHRRWLDVISSEAASVTLWVAVVTSCSSSSSVTLRPVVGLFPSCGEEVNATPPDLGYLTCHSVQSHQRTRGRVTAGLVCQCELLEVFQDNSSLSLVFVPCVRTAKCHHSNLPSVTMETC